jgi:hypothetical protein
MGFENVYIVYYLHPRTIPLGWELLVLFVFLLHIYIYIHVSAIILARIALLSMPAFNLQSSSLHHLSLPLLLFQKIEEN